MIIFDSQINMKLLCSLIRQKIVMHFVTYGRKKESFYKGVLACKGKTIVMQLFSFLNLSLISVLVYNVFKNFLQMRDSKKCGGSSGFS